MLSRSQALPGGRGGPACHWINSVGEPAGTPGGEGTQLVLWSITERGWELGQ